MSYSQARGLASRLGLAGAICLGLASTAHADNSLTEAGVSVSNTFELSYSVSGTAQPIITNDNASPPVGAVVQGTPTLFTVDRKVDLIVTATNSTLTSVPGADATLTFEVLNEGNDTAAYSFSVADLDSGATTFDASSIVVRYLVDANDNGTDDDGSYTTITQTTVGAGAGSAFVTGDVPKGDRVFVQVQGTIAAGVTDAFTDDVTLVAEVRNPTAFANEASGSPAAVTADTAGANVLEGTAQNVLADGTGIAGAEGAGDADGLYAATGVIEVQSPDLTAEKTVTVIKEPGIADPFVALTDCSSASAETDAKAVPGACVEYVIEVENTGASVSATNLVIDDVLPENVTFVSASLATTTTTGFDDDTGIGGVGPVLTFPTTPVASDCDGTASTCAIQLSDAILDAGEVGQIVIRALVK
ncbi:MAG: hypothetical protein AAFV59_10210 [Pseudomonadota bacterium]